MNTLRPIHDGLARLRGDDLHGELKAGLAVAAERELLRGFRESVNPYGEPWAPVTRRGPKGRAGKPLWDTGNLVGSRISHATSDGIEVGLSAPYASYQQDGTRAVHRRRALMTRARVAARGRARGPGGIRPRLMVPTAERGIGPIWGAAFEDATSRILRRRAA